MRFSPSSRRLLYVACALILFLVALAPSQAARGGGGLNGCPTPGDETWYYSDASHTTKVGECVSDCCNCTTCTCTGQITAHAVHIPVDWLWCPPQS